MKKHRYFLFFFFFLEIEIELFINNPFIYSLDIPAHDVGEGNHVTRERMEFCQITWHILVEKKGYIDLKNHTNIKGNDKKIKMERNKMSVLIFLQHLFLYFVITFFF